MSVSNRLRIRNYLRDLVVDTQFPVVIYDKGEARIHDTQSLKPSTAVCNEVASQFEIDRDMGRRLSRRRASWAFELRVAFTGEVSLEDFEKSLIDPLLVLPLDTEEGYTAARIHLLRSEVSHPPEQAPSGGTSVVYALEAELTRT